MLCFLAVIVNGGTRIPYGAVFCITILIYIIFLFIGAEFYSEVFGTDIQRYIIDNSEEII